MSMSAGDFDAEACVKMATNTRNTNKLKMESQQTKFRRQEKKKNLLWRAVVPLGTGGSTAGHRTGTISKIRGPKLKFVGNLTERLG